MARTWVGGGATPIADVLLGLDGLQVNRGRSRASALAAIRRSIARQLILSSGSLFQVVGGERQGGYH